MDAQRRQASCGLVFQFPERHFIGSNLLMELSVGTPAGMTSPGAYAKRMEFQQRVPQALAAVGMEHEPWARKPSTLSDGYKRRLALAVQLLRSPAVLLLDEPLAGASLWMRCTRYTHSNAQMLREQASAAGIVRSILGWYAGLDWRARKDLVGVLERLKQESSLLLVSHDLRELAPVADYVWEMLPGGKLEYRGTQVPKEALGGAS
jgi:energy-coupling factor transporter ATP-binding protein EcfA2